MYINFLTMIAKGSFLLACICSITPKIESYSYDVALSTTAQSITNVLRQHYLSDKDVLPLNNKFLRFQLRGRRGARLFLDTVSAALQNKIIYYYVLIGNRGNTISSILLVNDTLSKNNYFAKHKKVEIHSVVLSENQWREFWISWCGDTIKVGKGPEYNENLIMYWRNPCPFKILDIGIAGGYSLNWKFQSRAEQDNVNKCPREDKMCNSYSKNPGCPIFQTLRSLNVSKSDCAWQCSGDVNCWAWTRDNKDGTCNLLSGEVEQSSETSTVFFKQREG